MNRDRKTERVTVVSERERRSQVQDVEMKKTLNGMGGKRPYLDGLDRGTLHILMALKATGQSELVRRILTSNVHGLEWKVSLRNTDA